MSETDATSYDEIPYDSTPHYPMHPDCLAVAGALRGLKTAAPSRCRVLELGCGTGGNLIPMAYQLPESQFVGIDLSSSQIAAGTKLCNKLGLANIELRAASILDLTESEGPFDYITCHGVYSWVPPNVQDHILWACRHLLAPRGIAYVSYNTYPGWHQRAVARDLMRFFAARFDDSQTKVKQARNILGFMSEATAKCKGTLAPLLDEEFKDMAGDPEHYIFHEHLEEVNSPVYFHEFMSRAARQQLQYLGEAWFHTPLHELPSEVLEQFKAISRTVVELEQFVDFVKNKKFRRSLLCHAETDLVRAPGPEVMQSFLYSAVVVPVSAAPDVTSAEPEKFRLDDGTVASTNCPILKAALVALFEHWPQTIPFEDLFLQAADRSSVSAEARPENREILSALLRDAYFAQLVAAHVQPSSFTMRVGWRPKASALARAIAAESSRVPSLRHHSVDLDEVDRTILQLADGTRTHEEIAAQAAGRHNSMKVDTLHESLGRLAQSALLEA